MELLTKEELRIYKIYESAKKKIEQLDNEDQIKIRCDHCNGHGYLSVYYPNEESGKEKCIDCSGKGYNLIKNTLKGENK